MSIVLTPAEREAILVRNPGNADVRHLLENDDLWREQAREARKVWELLHYLQAVLQEEGKFGIAHCIAKISEVLEPGEQVEEVPPLGKKHAQDAVYELFYALESLMRSAVTATYPNRDQCRDQFMRAVLALCCGLEIEED